MNFDNHPCSSHISRLTTNVKTIIDDKLAEEYYRSISDFIDCGDFNDVHAMMLTNKYGHPLICGPRTASVHRNGFRHRRMLIAYFLRLFSYMRYPLDVDYRKFSQLHVILSDNFKKDMPMNPLPTEYFMRIFSGEIPSPKGTSRLSVILELVMMAINFYLERFIDRAPLGLLTTYVTPRILCKTLSDKFNGRLNA